MSKVTDLLRQLQADSLVIFMKTHNFHWNVRGSDFFHVHEQTQKIYERFAEIFDDLAELILQLEGIPVVTLTEALKTSKIKEESKTTFTSKDIFKSLIKDYEYLLGCFEKLSELAEKAGKKIIINYADEQIGHLHKALYMMNATMATK